MEDSTELDALVDEEIGVVPTINEIERKIDTSQWNSMNFTQKLFAGLSGEDLARVIWLSLILFFLVGTYWLLSSLKDPIMSSITGVNYSIFS